MEELVSELADLQYEKKEMVDRMNQTTREEGYDERIKHAEKELARLNELRAETRYPYEWNIGKVEDEITRVSNLLLNEWDGKTKTRRYPSGVLSFRTTKRLHIIDDVRLMELLIEKAPIFDVVSKYIKGFKLADVKKFVEVHNVQTGVAQIESKTSVSLKTE
jgi:hypothetical protein